MTKPIEKDHSDGYVTSKLLWISKCDNGGFSEQRAFYLNTDVAAFNLLSINGNKYTLFALCGWRVFVKLA